MTQLRKNEKFTNKEINRTYHTNHMTANKSNEISKWRNEMKWISKWTHLLWGKERNIDGIQNYGLTPPSLCSKLINTINYHFETKDMSLYSINQSKEEVCWIHGLNRKRSNRNDSLLPQSEGQQLALWTGAEARNNLPDLSAKTKQLYGTSNHIKQFSDKWNQSIPLGSS